MSTANACKCRISNSCICIGWLCPALRTFTLRKCCAVREWQVWGSRGAAPVQLKDGGFGPSMKGGPVD
jgi:hypothetical protein